MRWSFKYRRPPRPMESEQTRFAELEAKRNAGLPMTGSEWNLWDYLFQKLDPPGHEAYRREARRRQIMLDARSLSLDDLRALLAEKETARSNPARELTPGISERRDWEL